MGWEEISGQSEARFQNDALEVRAKGETFFVCLKVPTHFEIGSDKKADLDVFMVWLNLLRKADGGKIVTLEETARSFGYKNRQDVDNRAQRWREAGGSILGVVAPYTDRPWVLTAPVREAISEVWSENLFLTSQEVREEMLRQGWIGGEEEISLGSIDGWAQASGLALLRRKLKSQLERGDVRWRSSWLLGQAMDLVSQMQETLQEHGLLPEGIRFRISSLKQRLPEPVRNPKGASISSKAKAEDIQGFFLGKELLAQNGLLAEEEADEGGLKCTRCGSSDTWKKTEKIVEVAFGFFRRTVKKIVGYCWNPDCPAKTFTSSKDLTQFTLENMALVTLLYTLLRGSFGRIAIFVGASKRQVYRLFADFGQAMGRSMAVAFPDNQPLVICVDEKYVKIPKHFRGKGLKGKFCYVYIAVHYPSLTILYITISDRKDQTAAELFLSNVKFLGYRPYAIVSDNDTALSPAIAKVFPRAIHHLCIFHQIKNMRERLEEVFDPNSLDTPKVKQFAAEFENIFDCYDARTCTKRFQGFMGKKESYLLLSPALTVVFDSLERDFPKLVNSIGSQFIPDTNNSAEEVIRIFSQHYKLMCGFESVETAQIQIDAFAVVHNFTPFTEDAQRAFRGKCPLEIAGVDVSGVPLYYMLKGPIAERVRQLVVQRAEQEKKAAA